ncbi:MAG: hypothetical protein ACAI44_38320 [Candidatus Sericytochromatia bacterium]
MTEVITLPEKLKAMLQDDWLVGFRMDEESKRLTCMLGGHRQLEIDFAADPTKIWLSKGNQVLIPTISPIYMQEILNLLFMTTVKKSGKSPGHLEKLVNQLMDAMAKVAGT